MKRFLIILMGISLLNSVANAQFVQWTFETSVPTTAGPHAAEVGTGSATALHADGLTAYSNPVGNGTGESFSSNRWGANDYYQFEFPATGYQDLMITWDATGSSTGPRDFKVQYSTDGTIFTDATGTNSTYSLTGETWSSTTYNPISTRTLDLSSVTALNNAAAVYIRLVSVNATSIGGGSVANGGTSRVDDFKVSGNLYTTNTISVTTVTPLTFNLADCFTTGSGMVDFTSVGTFTAGNVYTAELSDAAGAFGTPIIIGTFSSTSNSGTINITIPAGTASGTLYKIRIKSDNPVVTSNLSADITINQSGSCNSASTDFFRSKVTGDWNSNSTWETSATGGIGTWMNATLTPTSAANVIQIRNGHTVSITSDENADQVVIENGGILNQASGNFTIQDGTGDDVDIESGGVFELSFETNPPLFGSGSPTVNISTGGILRVAAPGLTSAAPTNGVNVDNYVYQDLSILEYTLSGGFATSNVTYFPNVDATTIPIFRATNPSTSNLIVGAGNPTIFNGIFEYTSTTADLIWQNAGNKTFRNGIIGAGNISANASADNAKFIINGVTAEFGGTGSLTLPAIGGLEIGSSSNNTTVILSSDKTVTGDISLLSTNDTYVDLGTYNLIVYGNVVGGTVNSYIRTQSSGELALHNVDAAGKTFPVGDSKYNPIIIENGNNYEWFVNVNDGIVPDATSTTDGAVLLTWHITPSTNPPASGADITFQFDPTSQVGSLYDTPPYNTPDNLQAWHQKNGYWLASGITAVVMHPSSNVATFKSTGLTEFSPYGLSRIWLPLPIKLIDFTATKISSTVAAIHWELAQCCAAEALFTIEKSTDSRHFETVGTMPGDALNISYQFEDHQLAKGITYYRLRMKDVDGSVQYSKIIAIVNGDKGIVINSIAPNPVLQVADISISSGKAGVLQFRVFDMSGRRVSQWQSAVSNGTNHIQMNVDALPGGIYTVQVRGADVLETFRFVKQ